LIRINPSCGRPIHACRMSSQHLSYRVLTRQVSHQLAGLRANQPGPMRAFGDLSRSTMVDGALTAKTKELIALALGVAAHCDASLGFHAKALVELGATRAEVEDALAVAIYMGGGPSLLYSANAIAAYQEFADKAPEAA
jgi:AhpD family alkylhydroperoxidase